MKIRRRRVITEIFLLTVVLLLSAMSMNAATLYGTVVEVIDGDTLTIRSMNKPVKIRLLAVVAPAPNQPFSDLARQHLSDLVLSKTVLVEYSGLAENNVILGKVTCKDVDTGAQMLRDGVAWFDKSASNRLTDSDRQLYSECELAARAERRGLWQDQSPIPPWEFAKQAAARSLNQSNQEPSKTSKARVNSLGSEDLLSSFLGPSAASRRSASAETSGASGWRELAPEREHFSVSVPGTGYESAQVIPAADRSATISYWTMDYEGASYVVMWSKGPNLKYNDDSALDDTAKGVVAGLNKGFEKRGSDFVFEAKLQSSLKLNGYTGNQYSVSAERVPGVIRVFSKQVGSEREFFMVGVLNSTDSNPSVQKFFNSLSLIRKQ